MAHSLTDRHRATISAVCNTFIRTLERRDDPDGLWGSSGSGRGTEQSVVAAIEQMPQSGFANVCEVLESLDEASFATAPRRIREQSLHEILVGGDDAAVALRTIQRLTITLSGELSFYRGGSSHTERDVISAPAPKAIVPIIPEGDSLEIDADVVVVGSGAGGGVIAGTLALQGLKVVVLEAGKYRSEDDFTMLQGPAFNDSYWRGGPAIAADGNVWVQAGAGLGGGTVINESNCMETRPLVRDQWAREFGLEGVDGAEYDRHLNSVRRRIMINGDCSDLNGPQLRMQAGADALEWSFKRTHRNADPATYDPLAAGFTSYGDASGSKQSTLKTYLQDAFDAGADIFVNTSAQTIRVTDGKAAGIDALYTDPDTGRTAAIRVNSEKVVVACGALESPALLLRSGIGGPAVGQHLHLHPCTAVSGLYAEDLNSWWGPAFAGYVDEFADAHDGWGWIIEGVVYTHAAMSLPRQATPGKPEQAVNDFDRMASFIGLLRDRSSGQVTIDRTGNPVYEYAMTDATDIANSYDAVEGQIRLHEAAGAISITSVAAGLPRWNRGENIAAFIDQCRAIPLQAGGHQLWSGHQMSSCRMGNNPETSVANPWGELHDTPGVWIGDSSALPTAPGTNPMFTIMALAHRTAEAISGIVDDASQSTFAARA